MAELRLRPTVRLLVIDDADRVLLFGGHEIEGPGKFWFTPGGGIEPGETQEQAARREMLEETGLTGFELGRVIWTRTGPGLLDGETVMYQSTGYLVRVPAFAVDTTGFSEIERNSILEFRWWSVADLRATTDRLVPGQLADLVASALDESAAQDPVDLSPRP